MEKSFNGESIRAIGLGEIKIPAERQRKIVNGIEELARSIEATGLINPIVVNYTDGLYYLVAGERRLKAFQLLHQQKKPGYDKIPCKLESQLSEEEAALIEFEENAKRHDLDWKDHVMAMRGLIMLHQKLHPDWPLSKIADTIGSDHTWVFRCMQVAAKLVAGDERVKNATGIYSALNIIERERERKKTAELDKIEEELYAEAAPIPSDDIESPEDPRLVNHTVRTEVKHKASIIQGNFCQWAEEYSGPKFNFIHCDFPYGINHQDSDQGGAKTWGAYEDSEDTYWMLLGHLLKFRDKLMLANCHIMFWYSMKFHEATLKFISQHAPDISVVDEYPLVWHKSDNKGIVPDVARRPRRVYETALMLVRGDRKIIKPVSNCCSIPTNKSGAIHISEKPIPVLRHFFEMFVDDTTRVLDPTCGGGTSIRTAEEFGAELAVGIELDELYAEAAQKALVQARGLAALSEKVSQDA